MASYLEHRRRVEHQKACEDDGVVADSMAVRLALIARMDAGELTLEQVQAELKRIKRGAAAAGKITRAQAYGGQS